MQDRLHIATRVLNGEKEAKWYYTHHGAHRDEEVIEVGLLGSFRRILVQPTVSAAAGRAVSY